MAMIVARDNLWLCEDCRIIAVNGDYSGLDYTYGRDEEARDKRAAQIDAGLERLGPHLVNDEGEDGEGYEEFMVRPCDCCMQSRAAGSRFRFAILGEAK